MYILGTNNDANVVNGLKDNVKVKSWSDLRRLTLKKIGITSKAAPCKAQKLLSPLHPSFSNCDTNDYEGVTSNSEIKRNVTTIINKEKANSDEDGVCNDKVKKLKIGDDKVKKLQIARWRAHRKKMLRQSKTYSSLEAHKKLIISGLNRTDCTDHDTDCLSTSSETLLMCNNNTQSSNQSVILLFEQISAALDKADRSEPKYCPPEGSDKDSSTNNFFNDLFSGLLSIKC